MTVPLAFTSLPVDLLCSVTEQLDVRSLARFAAACSACHAVAHKELRDAWLNVVKRCLSGKRFLHLLQIRAKSAWETETFKGNSRNLKSLLLGDLTAVTFVGHNAFRDCSALCRCVLPTGLVTIGGGAFNRCTSLAELTLPTTLTSIGESAFYGCSSLTSLTFPASLVAIDVYAFSKCSALTNVDFSAVTDASIGRCAFLGCERLAKLTLPTALSRIDEYAFAHCSALVELTLPAALNHIDQFAFEKCTSLTTLIFPAAPMARCDPAEAIALHVAVDLERVLVPG